MVRRAIAVVCLVACSSDVSTTVEKQPIIRGIDSDPSQDYVVYLYAKDDDSACTGTLIAPNLVLTARHCVSHVQQSTFGCDEMGNIIGISGSQILSDHAPSSLLVYTGSVRANAPAMTPDAVGAKIFHDTSKNLCGHDVSLILLDREIPNALFAQIRLDDTVTIGETFTAVGWGVTDKTIFPFYRQQRKGIKITSVGPMAAVTTFQPTPPNDFQVGESICSGDSGGPAFAKSGAIVGIVSRGGNGSQQNMNDPSATCIGAENIYTKVAPFKSFIEKGLASVGAEPWYEGGPDPRLAKTDASCTKGSECRSNLCVADPSNGGAMACAQDCSADPSACPDGQMCTTVDSAQICRTAAAIAATNNATVNGGNGQQTVTTSSCSAAPGRDAGSSGSSLAMIGLGALGFAAMRRRKI